MTSWGPSSGTISGPRASPFDTPAATDGLPTARCLILVTADAQRTMQTFLGASQGLGPDDIDTDLIAAARLTYLEGYLWDPPRAKEAFVFAAAAAHQAGREVALSLSDPFCVDRHREDFRDLVAGHVDVLFRQRRRNQVPLPGGHLRRGPAKGARHCRVAALTRGAKGSVVISGDQVHVIDAAAVDRVVDTTGAGDAYAAGFLYGLTREAPLPACARMGNIAAAEVIGHMGARPDVPLKELIGPKLV